MPLSQPYLDAKLVALRATFPHAGDFCLHTDVENLVSILSAGILFCRDEVSARGLLRRDCASAEVLGRSPDWVHGHARLYFAPKTPYAYRTEGPRRATDAWPVIPRPVYLVFSPSILLAPDVKVSDGNMGSFNTTVNDASDTWFESLPFPDIFDRGSFRQEQRDGKIRRRHAEVLVPRGIALTHLQRLVFRSEAERDLALFECHGFPAWVSAEVDPIWFYAEQNRLLHLVSCGGPIRPVNMQAGDKLGQIVRNESGAVRAWQCEWTVGGWTPWTEFNFMTSTWEVPPVGRSFFFLNGLRVGVNPPPVLAPRPGAPTVDSLA